MYICGCCGGKIEDYNDIGMKILNFAGQEYIQETCPHCNGDIRDNHVVGTVIEAPEEYKPEKFFFCDKCGGKIQFSLFDTVVICGEEGGCGETFTLNELALKMPYTEEGYKEMQRAEPQVGTREEAVDFILYAQDYLESEWHTVDQLAKMEMEQLNIIADGLSDLLDK